LVGKNNIDMRVSHRITIVRPHEHAAFILKQWEQMMAFLEEATMAFAITAGVFSFFDCNPRKADALDFSGFVDSMMALCSKQKCDDSGIEDLKIIIAIFDSYHESVRLHRMLPDDEFRRGLVSVRRYRCWLDHTFPDP
jgi:hypothetical protein